MPKKQIQAEPLLISVVEAAQLLSVGPRMVERLCASGELPHVRLGRRLLLPRAELVAAIAARTRTKAAP